MTETDSRSNDQQVHVSIEVKRIQTFLFAIPRLKAMAGANAILGETMRGCWDSTQNAYSAGSLAELAVRCGAVAPGNSPEFLPSFEEDPLGNEDQPGRDWKHGIVARDGGRFIAAFRGEEPATTFARQARALLQTRLPGALVKIEYLPAGEKRPASPAITEEAVPFLPQFEVCNESGSDPASEWNQKKERFQSRNFLSRQKSADEVNNLKTKDPVSLFYNGLLEQELYLPNLPSDFDELCRNSYLAVLHADGNNIGRRMKEYSRDDDAKAAVFFHRMRGMVRSALARTIKAIFAETRKQRDGDHDPFRILMLGGDDLLMVMQAEFALPFAETYARNLAQMGLMPDEKPLSVGCGIVIARPSYPFFRLHEIAEELAASAKRLARGDFSGSVIDWHVTTDSHIQSVLDRRRKWVIEYPVDGRTEKLVLSNRPMPILQPLPQDGPHDEQEDTDTPSIHWVSLEKLQERARHLKELGIPRSPLREVRDALFRGRRQAEITAADFYFQLHAKQSKPPPWLKTPWAGGGDAWTSQLLDIIEIFEIPNLQTQRQGGEAS